jgi:protein involved in polysaccharide export with SLBB domain
MQRIGKGRCSQLKAATVRERWVYPSRTIAALTCGVSMLCLLFGCTASRFSELQLSEPRPLGIGNPPLPNGHGSEPPRDDVARPYQIGFPDEIEITVADPAQFGGRFVVNSDGRIDLGNLGRLRVDGKTTVEVAAIAAELAGIPLPGVHVNVRAYRSQQVYLVGEVRGRQRAVPYQGPERVVELLQRVGGLTPGAALGDVYLIRSHVTDGQTPEVVRIDIQSIVAKRDLRTNYIVRPFDEISVGETTQSSLARCLPPWMLPIYQSFLGLKRS